MVAEALEELSEMLHNLNQASRGLTLSIGINLGMR